VVKKRFPSSRIFDKRLADTPPIAMTTTLIIRLCAIALIILGAVLGWQAIDKEDMGMRFIYMIVVGVVGGLAGVKYIIPWIGDAMGTFFFSSGEEVAVDDSMKAVAKLAQGDYEGAIAEYEKIAREKPRVPVSPSVSKRRHGSPTPLPSSCSEWWTFNPRNSKTIRPRTICWSKSLRHSRIPGTAPTRTTS
jgi:uncharacterized membrane protein YeaQ/YmgE (transglycosylase-associated protein family)